MNIKKLSFNISLKHKIENIKNIFESYVYSYKVLNKKFDKNLINLSDDCFIDVIISHYSELKNKYKNKIPNIGDTYYGITFLGLIKNNDEIIMFFDDNENVKIKQIYIDDLI